MRSWIRAPAVLAALAVLAGCGGGQSDQDKAKSTVQSYVDGLASSDGQKVCDQLSESVQTLVKARAKTKDCKTAIDNFEKSQTGRAVAPAFKTAKVKGVTTKGNT